MTESETLERQGVVVDWRNDPALREDLKSTLTLQGKGIVDWGTGWSWDHTLAEKNHRGAAKRSFKNMSRLQEHGGYGIIHTDDFEEVVIGRTQPQCVQYQKYPDGSGEVRKYKLVQFDEWAVVGDLEKFDSDLYHALENRLHLETVSKFSDDIAVPQAFTRLDLGGRVQRRA